jgi:hypothetical protein
MKKPTTAKFLNTLNCDISMLNLCKMPAIFDLFQ